MDFWKWSSEQFLENHPNKICERKDVNWQYVSTAENPADKVNCSMLLTKMTEL